MAARAQGQGPLTCRYCVNGWQTFHKYSTFRAHLRVHHQISTFDRQNLSLFQTYPGSIASVEFEAPRQPRSREGSSRNREGTSRNQQTAVPQENVQGQAPVLSTQLDVSAIEKSIADGACIPIRVNLIMVLIQMLLLLHFPGFEKGLKTVLRSIHSYLGPVPVPVVEPPSTNVQLSVPNIAEQTVDGVPEQQVHLDFGRISKAIDFNTGAPLIVVEPPCDQVPKTEERSTSVEGNSVPTSQADTESAEAVVDPESPEVALNAPDANDSDVIIEGEYVLNADGTTMEVCEKDGEFTAI